MQWTAGVATAILLLAQVAAGETIQGSTYPPPGGVTFEQTGASAGDAGGATFHFSDFDLSAFGELYWGVASEVGGGGGKVPVPKGGVGPRAELGGKKTLEAMGLESIGGEIATWSGYADWMDPVTGGWFLVPTKFTITISGLGANPWIEASSLGLTPAIGALVDNSSGLDFSATLKFFADIPTDDPIGFIPINEVPQSADGLTRTSFNGGFYYTNAAPAPTAGAGLIGMALTVAALALRRRLKK